METITFWSGSSPLTDGAEIQYDARSEPGAKSVTVSGTLKIDFFGSCEGSVSHVILQDGTFTLDANGKLTIPFDLSIACSVLKGSAEFTDTGTSLKYRLTTEAAVQPFMSWNISGEVSLTKVSYVMTLTQNAAEHTSITVENKVIGSHKPTNCDGGCYCYCQDGSQIDDNGQLCPPVYNYYYSGEVSKGQTLKISAKADSGYTLGTMTINNITYGSGAAVIHEVTCPVSISTALVDGAARLLTFNRATGTEIIVTRADGQILKDGRTIFDGDVLTVSAKSSASYEINTLTINGSEFTEFTQPVTVSGDLTISTSSTRKYGLTFDADEGAVISVARNGIPLTEGYHLYYGDTLTLSVSAESGHKITSLYVSGASSDGSGLTRTLTVTGDVVITARTRQIPLLNISTDTGTWLTYKKVLRDPYPSTNCDGGCYCYCDGMQVDDGAMCPGEYSGINISDVCIGDKIIITPHIDSGYNFESLTINDKTYITATEYSVIVGTTLTISLKTISAEWHETAADIYISGGKEDVSVTVAGLEAGRKTRVSLDSGQYTGSDTTYTPATNCDGCYCYCGAEQVFYGDMCPHTKHYSASISANSFYNIQTGETDLMTSGVSGRRIVGAKLAIPSDNTLVFGGYIENCDSYGKSIRIKKIEQYYPEEQQ